MTARDNLPDVIRQGLALQQQGQLAEAEACYRKILEIDRHHVDANHLLGVLKAQEGRTEEALGFIEAAAGAAPNATLILMNYGNILSEVGRHQEALSRFDRALAIDPQLSSVWSNRGNTLNRLKRYDEAVASHERAIDLSPNDADALYNLGLSLHRQGHYDRANAHFDRALELRPGFIKASVARCVGELHVLYTDESEIDRQRSAYRVRLQALAHVADRSPREFASAIDATPPFFLPYQGQNDRDLQRLYGAMVCRAMAAVAPPSQDQLAQPAAAGEQVRVGIVSGFFSAHSNWKIPIKGWLSQLDRRRFRLLGYHTGIAQDGETEVARSMFDRFVQGPLPVHALRNAILADRPHVLIYPEIGMDPRSLQLAAQRLAPAQCNSWGHPVTSGFPTIDYYLSSDLMEPADAESHYTEELVRLPNLSIYYEPVATVPVTIGRQDLGLRSQTPTYWCGQSLYKYLPQYDHVFPGIARKVGSCQFVFIDYSGQEVNALFRRRLSHAFGAVGLNSDDHCVFLSPMSQDRFVAAMGQCDVFLDSIGWSGCNSTLESLAHNLPIVTMPGALMRGRHSLAILAMMGLTGTVASSTDDYIAIAARLGLDVAWRDTLREATARSKHRLYRDGSSIAALENFLDRVARQDRRALKGSPLHHADASARSGPKQEPAPAHLASLTLETADVVRPFYFRPKSSDENVIRQVFQQQHYALQHFSRWPDLLDLIARNATHNRRPLVIDAGANIGASAVYFATKIPGAKVVAIEPVAENFDILRRNSDGLEIEAIRAALSSRPGRSEIVDPGLGFWGLRTEAASVAGRGVPNVTVPELFRAHAVGLFPFMVKVDIEGAEGELFSENTEWVQQTPLIMIELHDWLLPKKGTALPFLRAVAGLDRDFILIGEGIASIANDI